MTVPWPLGSLALVLTGACNLRCEYCFQTVKRGGRMSWPTAKAAIDCLRRSTSPARRLVLTGGEPLLAYPLVRRIVTVVRADAPRARAIRIALLTNGTRLGDERAAFLAANRVAVQVSLDGVAAAQAARGAWTFPYLDGLLDRLRRQHPSWFARSVSVAVTVPPVNVPHLAESVEYLLSKGVRSVKVSPAIGPLPGWTRDLRDELDRQFNRVLDVSLSFYRRTGRVPLASLHAASPPAFARSQAMCGATRGVSAVVDVDGLVYGCAPAVPAFGSHALPLLRRASRALRLGRITDPRLADRLPSYRKRLLATGLFGPRGELHSAIGPCRSCRLVGRCTVCPLAIACAPGSGDPTRVPDYICAFNTASLACRARFQRRTRAGATGARPGAA